MKTYAVNGKLDVLFNGKPLIDIVWADSETGEVEIKEHDKNGNWIPDMGNPIGHRTMILKGIVEVVKENKPEQLYPDSSCTGYDGWGSGNPGFCFEISPGIVFVPEENLEKFLENFLNC